MAQLRLASSDTSASLFVLSDRTRSEELRDRDLLRLYERWLRTGSERIRKLLLEAGLLPTTPTAYDD